MNTAKLKSRLLIATLATGVGVGVLLLGKKVAWIPDVNVRCVKASNQSSNLIYDVDTASEVITASTLIQQPERGRSYQIVHVTDDPDHIFEHTPPSPLDYAVILESLRNRGYDRVILATRMTWDKEPGLEAAGLSSRLAKFKYSVIALPVTRGATALPLPDALHRVLIPFSQVHGNRHLIPMVNQVSLPAHAGGGKRTLAGFSAIESAPASAGTIPMLAHWDGAGLIPSLELLTLMAAHDVSLAEVTVRAGKHIRLGKEGPVIPIDRYGQTIAPHNGQKIEKETQITPPVQLSPLKAEDLITHKPASPMPEHRDVCIIQAMGSKTEPTSLLSQSRMNNILHLSTILPVPADATSYRRLPLWAEVIIIFDLALFACWFSGFTLGNRRLATALTATLLFPLLFAFIDLTGHWFGVVAPLATLLVAWLIPVSQRKQTSPIQDYSTSDAKPIIRA